VKDLGRKEKFDIIEILSLDKIFENFVNCRGGGSDTNIKSKGIG
jgi:hypothetical protein